MAIPDEDVAKVRQATDIAALIGEHTSLRRVGRRYVGLCPFHEERSPSFSVNVEDGLYYCFGCQVSGDAISFIRAVEGCEFVEAVERLAARAGITVRNDADRTTEGRKGRRQQLYEALLAGADFYHQYLLTDNGAGAARQYLRSRGYDGETVREFKIGFAPPGFDALVRSVGLPTDLLKEAGLAYVNSRGSANDAFRERVIFPIFDPGGRVVALGGRVLPEQQRTIERDPGPKYRNSPESSIYQKRATLYGLNWAKTEIAKSGEAIICEGYTDVIGFFRAGARRAVATCGTSLTDEHFRLLSRFAKRVVLCFDADSAGVNAAERIYEWERRHELEIAVARLPPDSDPAELARSDPERLRDTIATALRYLEFRIDQALSQFDLRTPESRARAAEAGVAMIAEHPNDLVRDEYLIKVADRTHLDPTRLRELLEDCRNRKDAPGSETETAQGSSRSLSPEGRGNSQRRSPERPRGGASDKSAARGDLRTGRDALLLMIHRGEEVPGFFKEVLFVDALQREAFVALSTSASIHDAIEKSAPEVADFIRELSVTEGPDEIDPDGTLVRFAQIAGRRVLQRLNREVRAAAEIGDEAAMARTDQSVRFVKGQLEQLLDPLLQSGRPTPATEAAERLVAWFEGQEQEA